MKTIIDERCATVTVISPDGAEACHPLASPEGFAAVSRAWLRAGWDAKHVYSFTWLGRPIIQLPEDMFRVQELIHATRPDVLIETGIAHGGSLIFYASLFEAMGHGRVIGIDVDIRAHNRAAIESHPLAHRITLIEGSSIAPEVVAAVKHCLSPQDMVMAMLDSNHSHAHVLAELRAYAPLLQPGGYAIAADGIMQDLAGAPRAGADWETNNPQSAAKAFVKEDDRFVLCEPEWLFNEGSVTGRVTYWPNAHLRRVR